MAYMDRDVLQVARNDGCTPGVDRKKKFNHKQKLAFVLARINEHILLIRVARVCVGTSW